MQQQPGRVIQAAFNQVVHWGSSGMLPENAAEMRIGYAERFSVPGEIPVLLGILPYGIFQLFQSQHKMAVYFRSVRRLLMKLEKQVFQHQYRTVMIPRLIAPDVCDHFTERVQEAF